MKKTLFYSLGLIMAFASLLVSCKPDNNELLYAVTVASVGNGDASFENSLKSSMEVSAGESVTVVAVPDENAEFLGWFVVDAENPVTKELVYKFIVSENISLVAKFTGDPVVTIAKLGSGSVSFKDYNDTSKEFPFGETATVIATPSEGCEFFGWFAVENGEIAAEALSEEAQYEFSVSGDVSLVAKFTICPVVSVSSTEHGRVSIVDCVEKEVAVLSGNEVVVVAQPDKFCDFEGWFAVKDGEINGDALSSEATYKFVVTEDIKLIAKFSKRPIVSIINDENGQVAFDNSTEKELGILPGEKAVVVATPNSNSCFLGWFEIKDGEINADTLCTETTYEFVVTEDVKLIAKFYPVVTVSTSDTGNGMVAIENSEKLSLGVYPGKNATIIATSDEGYAFFGWYAAVDGTFISQQANYTFAVNNNIELVARFYKIPEAVDLGLSSGTKWAPWNVGADIPEESGCYYAWGETEEKHEYSWASYKWCDGSENSITKYCTTGNYGNVDNKTVLEPADDVASVKWGDAWRIPTIDEQNELIKECTWEWTSYNDVKGYNVTGPNGNSIFLPATGYCYDSIVMNKDSYGYYWLNSLGEFDSNGAYLFFVSSKYEVWLRYGYRRCYGYPVRAVSAVE